MSGRRQVLSGIAASTGVAVGRVCLFDRGHVYVPRRYIERDQIPAEEARLHAAIDASRRELEEIRERIGGITEHRLLLDAQLLMHRDELLIDGAIELLRERCINAEWALSQTIARIAERMRSASEAYFRERAVDVENVGDRILHQLTGAVADLPSVPPDGVIVADDLGPADAAQLLKSSACGIAIDVGSSSSHTAILARALDIPAVVGAQGLSRLVADDDIIIVDAFKGEIIVAPSEEEIAQARARSERYRSFTRSLRARSAERFTTADGTSVRLDANVELPAEAALALQEGAAGIGLYRTEFLFLDRALPPSEEEQLRVYCDVAQVLAPKPVVFRTFDIGGDKLHGHESAPDLVNPALGLRALRLAFTRPELFETQLRAIVRATAMGDVSVMFPLVASVDELREARRILQEVKSQLDREGFPLGPLRVGCMIETPAAALIAPELAQHCDFFSVGTNDLVQYTLAADRTNPRVATLATPLHPAVLRLLDMTVRAGHDAHIDVAMCGGMAADPFAIPLVLGLGFLHLSVDLGYLPLARATIERVDLHDAKRLAQDALKCSNARAVRELLVERFKDVLGELWSEQGIDFAS